jgi:hypothetical protein
MNSRFPLIIWNWVHGLVVWLSVPIALAQIVENGANQQWSGLFLTFFTAAITSIGFFPLFSLLMAGAESRGDFTEAAGDVPTLTALRGGAEECLYRGLLLPAIGIGPQAVLFAVAHAFDFRDPGLKAARSLQCLLRGLAYGALAMHYGLLPVASGAIAYDATAFAAVEVLFREARSNRA